MPKHAFAFAGTPPGPAAARPVLLLIDDEPLVGRFIAHAAEECGYQSLMTTSVDRFRSTYRARHPDFVAVDLGVPGADGIEILRFLAGEKCAAPVIIISGFDRRVLESSVRFGEALGLNMAGLLEKPVLLHELAAVLCTPNTDTLQ